MPIGIRIGGAVVVGIAIVVTAFFLRGMNVSNAGGAAAVTGSFEGREYIGSKDSDGNGTSDWEDELRSMTLRANPDAPEYIAPETDSYEEPNTLTGQFSRTFFETYVQTDASGDLSPERMDAFLNASLVSLEKDAQDELYTKEDILIGETSGSTLRAYGNSVLEIIARHSFASENELAIFERALQSDSEAELEKLTNIADAYDAILTDTLTLHVPSELAFEHLALVNSYLAIRNDIRAMENSFTDPLYALVRVKRYSDDGTALHVSLKGIFTRLKASNITYTADEAGAGGRWFLEH